MRDGCNMCASDARRSFICMEGASGGGVLRCANELRYRRMLQPQKGASDS